MTRAAPTPHGPVRPPRPPWPRPWLQAGSILLLGLAATAFLPPADHSLTGGDNVARFQAACSTDNPYVAVAQLPFSHSESAASLVAVRDEVTDTLSYGGMPWVLPLASQGAVGSIYGIAYDWARGQLYAAAHLALPSPYGPGGSGAIYRIDVASGAVSNPINLEAGYFWHDPEGWRDRQYLARAAAAVGREGLGDIDIDATASFLSVVNLYDRRIYTFALPNLGPIAAFDHGAAQEPWASNARPLGLGYYQGLLYHGVVDSREDPSLPGFLRARIYRSTPTGGDMTMVGELRLDYPHDPPWDNWEDPTPDSFGTPEPYIPSKVQALVADIAFRPSGDPVVGLWPRRISQGQSIAFGDLVPASWLPSGTLSFDTTDHYRDEFDTYSPHIAEATLGPLAAIPSRDTIVAAMGSGCVNGVWWFDNVSGEVQGPETGYQPLLCDNGTVSDVEILCPPSTPTPTPSPTPSPSATPAPPTPAGPPWRIFLPTAMLRQLLALAPPPPRPSLPPLHCPAGQVVV